MPGCCVCRRRWDRGAYLPEEQWQVMGFLRRLWQHHGSLGCLSRLCPAPPWALKGLLLLIISVKL